MYYAKMIIEQEKMISAIYSELSTDFNISYDQLKEIAACRKFITEIRKVMMYEHELKVVQNV
jgi:methylmalonyl-CoA mutase N-terminal domain/subunit